jgi:hypothetical protein
MNALLTNRRLLIIGGGIVLVALTVLVLFFFASPASTPQEIVDNAPVQPVPFPSGGFEGVVFPTSDAYDIQYYGTIEQFLIFINAAPFEPHRQDAEGAFLTVLGISEEEACTLDVTIRTPAFVNPDQGGREFPLSFCP